MLAIAVLVALVAAVPAAAQTQSDSLCFAETGFCTRARIKRFWQAHGGVRTFGLPISEQRKEIVEGTALQTQWFERARLEIHPENPPPYDVLIGRLAPVRFAQQGRSWEQLPHASPQSQCRYFAETQQNICGEVLAFWRANGLEFDGAAGTSDVESLALLGFPLSGPMQETLSDGRTYTVQWFERSRVEIHPENPLPYRIQLGLLGSEVLAENARRGVAPQTKPVAEACTVAMPPRDEGLQVWMSNPHPVRGETTFVCARLTLEEEAVAGAVVAAVLHYRSGAVEREPATTDQDGLASMSVTIGEQASGTAPIRIDAWTTYAGVTYAGQTQYRIREAAATE
jgi:hypothetical protein